MRRSDVHGVAVELNLFGACWLLVLRPFVEQIRKWTLRPVPGTAVPENICVGSMLV